MAVSGRNMPRMKYSTISATEMTQRGTDQETIIVESIIGRRLRLMKVTKR